jgi:hypothetical protein
MEEDGRGQYNIREHHSEYRDVRQSPDSGQPFNDSLAAAVALGDIAFTCTHRKPMVSLARG